MSKKKKLLIIAGIIIALLAIAGGILMYLYCKMWYDYGEMNRREYNEAREKSPDYLALGVHKYSYPDDEFVLTENLQGVIEYSIAQDIDFTDCTPEQWQDDFIKYYLNSDYIGPEYKANLLEENDNKVSKEEAEY